MKSDASLTPMMRQYLEIKRECPDAVLFYRMGDFYEMFYDDAVEASRILGLALTTRDKGKEHPVPMCGVPFHSAQAYIHRLIKAGRKVAVCEQSEPEAGSRGLMRREIVRVVTPAIALEDDHLERDRANYLMSLWRDPKSRTVGLAFIDVSTGAFRATELDGEDRLLSEIARVAPSEVLIAQDFDLPEGLAVTRIDEPMTLERARDLLNQHFRTVTLDGFGLKDAPLATVASGMALSYVRKTCGTAIEHITTLRFYSQGFSMALGRTTIRNLELFETIGSSRDNTLYAVLNHTRTPMGARMLADWIAFPLVDVERIEERLDAVGSLLSSRSRLTALRDVLGDVPDMERIVGRICTKTAGPRDVRALADGLSLVPRVREIVAETGAPLLENALAGLDNLEDLRARIERTLVEAPPQRLGDGSAVASGVDRELDELRDIRRDSRRFLAELEARERESTGIPSLKVGYNRVFGYYIEIGKSQAAKAPDRYARRQTLVNAERFITPELKEYEAKLLGAQDAIAAIEQRIFEELRQSVIPHVPALKAAASSLALVDALASLAWAALKYGYCRPSICRDRRIEVVGGRHPVVERVLKPGEYVPNPCAFDPDKDTIHLITGPNMSGKSTYMRQVALICIMAQIGSFVSAESARIGVVDRIFTRIGALDNLSAGQSTFLVEMTETADILNNATEKSLVILDEIGRGTSTYDGMALAWAVAEYLNERRARTFFATHYHELADLSRRHKGVKNFHLAVEESGAEVVFLRTLRRGAIGRSFGIYVARLAGIPREVIERARNLLEAVSSRARAVPSQARQAPVQASLFEPSESALLQEILSVDLERMTPIEALNFLHRLKEKVSVPAER
ncbi:MAG TPA: DNA mismatch repair protein MutS [Deltaproteobacteria bacterium]|nr:DNA mismatch repair protein MutS [Deltaproteobacteria bacterium]HPP79874.1 DNA mismatch repair protein MutS [Deltaproteobacteria bacterium]